MNPNTLKPDIAKVQEIVIRHLRCGALPISIKNSLLELSIQYKVKCSEIFKAIPVDEHDPQLYKILGCSLNVNKIKGETSKEYPEEIKQLIHRHKNLYTLLAEIAPKDKHSANLLEWINSTKPPFNWVAAILSTTVLSTGLWVFFHFNKNYFYSLVDWIENTFPKVTNFIKTFFSLLKNVPLLLVASNTAMLLFSWYSILKNRSMSTENKLIELLFKTTTAFLAITGYILSYISAGVVTTPIAILFVLRSFMEGIKSIVELIRLGFESKNHITNDENPWRGNLAETKRQTFNTLAMQSAGIKLGAALLMAGAVIIMCFCPPSLLLTVFCLASICLIDLSKSVLVRHLENRTQNAIIHQGMAITGLEEDEEMYPTELYCRKQIQTLMEEQRNIESQKLDLEARASELDCIEKNQQQIAHEQQQTQIRLDDKARTINQIFNFITRSTTDADEVNSVISTQEANISNLDTAFNARIPQTPPCSPASQGLFRYNPPDIISGSDAIYSDSDPLLNQCKL